MTTRPSDSRRAWLVLGVGLLVSVVCAVLSDGVYHEDDLVHLQMAEWALRDPRYLLDQWGRPGFTLLYVLPAQFGWLAARIFTGVLVAATGWLTFRLAQGLGLPSAWTAPLLLWLQPLYFTLSYTTLTETAAALYLTGAMVAWQRGAPALSAGLISLLALTRHEAMVLLAVWAVLLWLRRAPAIAWLSLVAAPVLHNVLAFVFLHRAPLLSFLDPKPTNAYGSGHWFTMVRLAQDAFSPVLLLLAAAGTLALMRRRDGRGWWTLGVGWIVLQTVLFKFGLFASGGYARFLVVVSPVVALAAAFGLNRLLRLLRVSRHRAIPGPAGAGVVRGVAVAVLVWWVGVGAASDRPHDWWWLGGLLVALAVGRWVVHRPSVGQWLGSRLALWGATSLVGIGMVSSVAGGLAPRLLTLTTDQRCVSQTVDWLRANDLTARPLQAATPWLEVFLGGWRPWSRFPPFAERVRRLGPGELYLWDRRYAADRGADIQPDRLLAEGRVVEVFRVDVPGGAPTPCVRVLEGR